MLMQSSNFTLLNWAQEIASLNLTTISSQGLNKKLTFRHIPFVEALLKRVLKISIGNELKEKMQATLFKSFNRVFVEDSSCIKLPRSLAAFFKGAHSRTHGETATAKVQLRIELNAQSYEQVRLMGFRNNDQSYAEDIVDSLQPGDLAIRDRGYFVLKAFRAIMKKGAYFLTLLNYQVNLYKTDAKGEVQQIDLLKILKRSAKSGQSVVDIEVLAGAKEKLPVRLVAIKVPDQVAQSRRRKAKEDRSAQANHSKRYLELLGWNIFITNVKAEVWNFKDILKAYRLRWHIEIVFKCWKSKLDFDKLFNNKEALSPPRVIMTIYLGLIWIILFFVRWYAYLFYKVYDKTGKYLSILKFAGQVKRKFEKILMLPSLDALVDHLAYYCTYDKRQRPNFFDFLYGN